MSAGACFQWRSTLTVKPEYAQVFSQYLDKPEYAQAFSQYLDEAKEHVGVQRPLVRLVNHHDGVGGEVRLRQELSEKHPVRHVLEDGLVGGAVLEADGVAHLMTSRHGATAKAKREDGDRRSHTLSWPSLPPTT